MLKKSERLTKKQFDSFFAQGKRFHFPYCTIVYTPQSDGFHGAVVVGKKVAKRAVDRNTIRRRVYSQLYSLVKETGRTGVYIVLIKPGFIALPRSQAAEEIAYAIAGLLKKT